MQRPPCVAEAVTAAMNQMGNISRGVSEAELTGARGVYGTRVKCARLFHFPHPERVVFTANVTEALNISLFGLIKPGDHVIATDWDHNSVLRPLYALERQGVMLDFLHADRQGNLDLDELEKKLQKTTAYVVCTQASNLTGNLLDVAAVSQLAHEYGAKVILDAAQTAGCRPVDMGELGADVLCFTGHKGLMGPQGTGGMCVGPDVEIQPLLMGGTGVQSYLEEMPHEYPTRLEAGTLNGPGLAGLGAAIDYVMAVGPDAIHEKEMNLMKHFLNGVKGIPQVKLFGDFSQDRAAIASLNIGEFSSAEVADCLYVEYGIATRAGAHCAPRMHRALGTEKQGAVRFSFGWFNTIEEVERAVEAVRCIAEEWSS